MTAMGRFLDVSPVSATMASGSNLSHAVSTVLGTGRKELTTVSVTRAPFSVAQLVQIIIAVCVCFFRISGPRSLRSNREVMRDIPISLPLARRHLHNHLFRDVLMPQSV
jgi:hypothetical protein